MKFEKRNPSSGKVQCELYRRLMNLGIDTDVEYTVKGTGRLDLVVYKGEEVIAIIEAKKINKRFNVPQSNKFNGKQYNKYKALGIPLFYVVGMGQIEITINKIKDLYFS